MHKSRMASLRNQMMHMSSAHKRLSHTGSSSRGRNSATLASLLKKCATPSDMQRTKLTLLEFTQHAESCKYPDLLSTYYSTALIENTTIDLRIDVAGDGPLPIGMTRVDMDRHQSVFMGSLSCCFIVHPQEPLWIASPTTIAMYFEANQILELAHSSSA